MTARSARGLRHASSDVGVRERAIAVCCPSVWRRQRWHSGRLHRFRICRGNILAVATATPPIMDLGELGMRSRTQAGRHHIAMVCQSFRLASSGAIAPLEPSRRGDISGCRRAEIFGHARQFAGVDVIDIAVDIDAPRRARGSADELRVMFEG